jgi:hypothetical protein
MEEFRLERDGQPPLAFRGTMLAHASSHSPGKDRWFEVGIYRTEAGGYVVHGLGASEVRGESDRGWAQPAATGDDVVAALYRQGTDGPYLTRTSKDALAAAATVDDGIAGAYVVRL